MSTFLERIRARTRRQNAKRVKSAKKTRALGRPAAALEPLSLDGDQVSAIQNALGDQSLEPVPGPEGTVAHMAPEHDADSERELGDASPDDDAAPSPEPEREPAPPAPPGFEQLAESYVVERVEFAKSSNVRAAELNVDGTVTVEFADSKRYRYGNFSLKLLQEWRDAKSAGSWFHHNVKTKPDRHPVVAE